MLDKTQFYIDGAWVDPTFPNPFDVIDPSTEQTVVTISLGSGADVGAAVDAAAKAFASWAAMPFAERVALVEKLLEIYVARAGDMAEAISLEMGAPIDFALSSQTGAGTWHIEGFLDAAKEFTFEEPLNEGDDSEMILREPVGVCGLITPWNWPMNQVTLKVIPAVLVGCTVVLKPSEIAPLSSMVFAEMMDEAGFPAGVFNLVNGDGPNVGAALTAHDKVDMMSFTGSVRGGEAVGTTAIEAMKRVTLELGGKSPNLIFADLGDDLAAAVERGVRHCMNNTGQSCNAPTRMFVERSVFDEAQAIAARAADEIKVDLSAQSGSHIGPLVSQAQYDTMQRYVQVALDEGAELIAGGAGKPEGLETGYFAKPTVFTGVTNDMRIAQEEVFGPLLVMIPFDTEEEAVEMANNSPYGLAAYLNSNDKERIKRISRQLRAGMVSVNGASFAKGSPFGGYKRSGIGREGGLFGLEDFVEIKTIAV